MLKLSVFSQDEVESIHQATLQVLNETGVILKHREGREILRGAGAKIRGDRVLFPPDLTEKMMALCPHEVRLGSRGNSTIILGDGTLHWHNLGGAREIYDFSSGQRRPATIQDVVDSTRLLDALDGATTITPFFTPQDVPGSSMSLAMYRYALPNTTKALQGPGVQSAAEVNTAVRMAEVVGVPQNILTLSVSPVSPLNFPDELVGAMIEIARQGIVFAPLPCPTAGTTAPLSIAGALVQQNAEVLASLILVQLIQPGLPVIYCGRLAMMEPRTGLSVWGGVELSLASAGTVQIAHHYGLPVNVYGFSTNSHTLDIQNGYERALNAAIPALAGADELSGIGEMEAGVMGSFAQMVCDSEMAAGIQRLRAGFKADEDALAVPVISDVMDGSHNFLGQKHTRRYLREGEVLVTHLAERNSWETWEAGGRQSMTERAQAMAEHLIATHEVIPLDEHQEIELDALLAETGN
jgi:trimethylamine---corrinoid protein Co-methyltransferase